MFKRKHFLSRPNLRNTQFDESLSGTHTYNVDRIYPGYNLYEGTLIDSSGVKLKHWNSTYLGVIDKNGNYLAQERYESNKWGLYTFNDKPIWEKDFAIHHAIVVAPQNTILTFTKEMHRYKGRKVDFCVINEYTMDGKEISRWSTWENLDYLKTFHRPLELERPKVFFLPETARRKGTTPWGGNYDYYRLNSLQVIPENELGKEDKRFQKGNWLICFRHGSMIFILDRDTKKVVWKCIHDDIINNIEGAHSPQILRNGNLLMFDNGRYRGWSRIIEINPSDYDILWEYRAPNLFTLSEGYVQRLPNENYLITESEKGRVFELTPEKRIIWEFYHPDRQNESNSLHAESYGERQWIYRMVRYDKEFIDNAEEVIQSASRTGRRTLQ